MKIIQEKNQVTLTNTVDTNEWADQSAQRHINSTPDTTERLNIPNMVKAAASPPTMQMSHNNEMPPGYSICDQHGHNSNFRMLAPAGQSDVTDHVHAHHIARGYFVDEISAEQFANDHELELNESVGGFAPRADYLERE